MASQTRSPQTADHDRPTFVVEHVRLTAPGRLEVRGRWYGVRGRRFFRPELILPAGDGERRWLADLDHKPWAAVDGEQWLAAFVLDEDLDEKAGFELSVAPDITVRLADGEAGQARRRRVRPTEAILRAPRVRSDAPPSGPTLSERAQEIERLKSRLTVLGQELDRERERRASATADLERERTRRAADAAELERERERRAGVAQELEDERSETLRLRSGVGRLKAELDLARAAQAEGAAAAADLEEARQQLDKQRTLTDRLRAQLMRDRAAAAAPQTQEFRAAAQAGSPDPRTQAPPQAQGPPRGETRPRRDDPSPSETRPRRDDPSPSETRPRRDDPSPSETRPQRDDPSRSESRSQRDEPPGRGNPAPRPERPLNPSLRHRTNWLGRMLALVVILAVLAAIYLVIKTTVSL